MTPLTIGTPSNDNNDPRIEAELAILSGFAWENVDAWD